MKDDLKADEMIAGWTAAQWVTVFNETKPQPVFSTLSDALSFRLEWLMTKAEPAPYQGKGLGGELAEAAILLEAVM
jgi:hypothetical protein